MITRFFRKKRNMRIILWLVALMIIPGFLIWGINISGTQRRQSYAAIVNGKPITYREFYARLSDVEDRYRQIFGDKYSEIRDKLNIENGLLEEMIREEILLQQARKRRIRVFDNEIVEAVKSDPVFKDKDGKFDEKKYEAIISRMPDEELRKIEDDIRKKIMLEKLKNLIISQGNVEISDKDVDEYIQKNKLKKVDKESIRKILQWQKREKYFNDWYAKLREKEKVEIFLPFKKEEPVKETGNKKKE